MARTQKKRRKLNQDNVPQVLSDLTSEHVIRQYTPGTNHH